MNIVEIRAFPKRNIHSHHRVMQMHVDLGEHDGVLTSDIEGFVDRLLEAVPSLREHHCSRGYPGGLVERLREGTLLGHVLEHLVLELQTLAGSDVIYGKTRRISASHYLVVVEYECEALATAAAREAVRMLSALLAGERGDAQGALEVLNRVKKEQSLGPSTRAIIEAAERRGIPAMRLNERSLVQLGYGSEQKMIQSTITGNTSCIGVDTAGDKALCKKVLADCGIPVPEGFVVGSAEEAVRRGRDLGGPLAIKPRRGNQGRGVSLNLEDEASWELAYRLARTADEEVIVEQFIPGQQYRVLVVGDEVVAASLRIPPFVTGDGARTVRELVEELNADPQRGEGHEAALTRVPLDDVTFLTLSRQGLRADSIPEEGRSVRLRDGANLSTGGTAVDVTGAIHRSAASVCRRAARIVGLDVAGVDLVTEDISEPFVDRKGRARGAIVEVNAAPGLRMHHSPSQGRARDVAQAIVDHLFPQCQSEGRIPIVAVTGSNGKTTTTRLVEHLLSAAGYRTGMITSDGIYIAGENVVRGDTTGPWSAKVVLRDPRVEAAVLETARGGIIAGGLAFDYCDVAVVTNISSDHLGQDNVETLDDLINVKSLVVETVPRWGRTVLNADDPRVMGMADRSLGEPVLFSVEDKNLS
ncbi:MAG: cyanophycin synthetase, partial [Bacillota bacterium]